jgi:extracellular factor (EF) 3-hydroxypalmitic acid methyl ester biosynthesis protein
MRHAARKMSLGHNHNNGATRHPEPAAASRGALSDLAGAGEVTFQTADAGEASGRLVHLTRHAATFEAGPWVTALRTSQVLNHFKIATGRRVLYFGRAVVSAVVQTGDGLLCEAKLDELGSETAFYLPPPEARAGLQESYRQFFLAWQNNYRLAPEFKVLVADVRSYLTGVRHWLEELEFGWKTNGHRAELEQEFLATIAPRIIAAFNGQHERFEEFIYALPPEARGAHQEFVRQHWHRLFLGSPFGHRTYHKPLGYAGDYEMMNMIYRNQPEGGSLYEKLIHLLLVSQWPAQAVRHRADLVRGNLLNETARAARAGKMARILSVGCGPAREIQDFLRESPLSDQAEFTLMDFNQETLAHTSQKLAEVRRQFSRRARFATRQLSVFELLKRTQQRNGGPENKFDLIYCAGLFDYLAPPTCEALMSLWHDDWLAPGGLLLVANMDDTKPFRHFIEFILDWQLIYRSSREFFSLTPEHCQEHTRVTAEPVSVNLFLNIRKPD